MSKSDNEVGNDNKEFKELHTKKSLTVAPTQILETNTGTKVEITVSLLNTIASAAAVGSSAYAISKDVNLSETRVKRIIRTKECQAIIKEIGDKAREQAIAVIRSQMSSLASQAMDVLRFHLKNNNLNAVALILKTIDKEDLNVDKPQDTKIQIIMPTVQQDTPITIDAEAKEVSK